MTEKTCPDCLSGIPAAATFCRHCGERVEGRPCAGCGARNWSEATVCRWCRTPFETAEVPADFKPFAVTANRMATFFQRGRLLPQTITLTRDKILIVTPGVFSLSEREEEIPWSKVAGFDYRSGLIWDQVNIETRGQSSSVVPCLAKADGQRIRQLLQKLEV